MKAWQSGAAGRLAKLATAADAAAAGPLQLLNVMDHLPTVIVKVEPTVILPTKMETTGF